MLLDGILSSTKSAKFIAAEGKASVSCEAMRGSPREGSCRSAKLSHSTKSSPTPVLRISDAEGPSQGSRSGLNMGEPTTGWSVGHPASVSRHSIMILLCMLANLCEAGLSFFNIVLSSTCTASESVKQFACVSRNASSHGEASIRTASLTVSEAFAQHRQC